VLVVDYVEKGQLQNNMSSGAENSKILIRNDPWPSHMFMHSNAINDIQAITLKWEKMGIGNDMEVLLGERDIQINRFDVL
jgi:hypothetical protein